jgi:methionine-R-sulfoxide reductase
MPAPSLSLKHKLVAGLLLGGGLMPSAPAALSPEAQAQAPQGGWKRPTDDELKKKLTPIQFSVTRRDDTEFPFRNEYWDNHEDGIYVDIISGEPLFSSLEKYDSGTGWPSFWKPLEPGNIRTKTDFKLGYPRTEVRSKMADSHLGHVFDDGPRPTGLRYCMNSAAMRFIPVSKLAAEGYGKYLPLFARKTPQKR